MGLDWWKQKRNQENKLRRRLKNALGGENKPKKAWNYSMDKGEMVTEALSILTFMLPETVVWSRVRRVQYFSNNPCHRKFSYRHHLACAWHCPKNRFCFVPLFRFFVFVSKRDNRVWKYFHGRKWGRRGGRRKYLEKILQIIF